MNETKTCVRNARIERFDLRRVIALAYTPFRTGRSTRGASVKAQVVLRLKGKISEALRPQTGEWGEMRNKLNRMRARWEASAFTEAERKTYRALNAHTRTTVRHFLPAPHSVLVGHPHPFTHGKIFAEWGVHELGAVDDAERR